jgi:hypothetical protein
MSAKLLRSYTRDKIPITRTFIHDAESLLWTLVWVVAHRSQDKGSWKINTHAQQLIRDLSRKDMRDLGTFKSRLFEGQLLARDVYECNNDWSKALAPVVHELAVFFRLYFYEALPVLLYDIHSQVDCKDEKEHAVIMSESRGAIFDRLFTILDAYISRLNHYSIDLTHV